jgi:predicted DNA-binding protein YlxM (UPF0122 family)
MKKDIYSKSIYISMLLEMYGKLLTERQADIVDLYYNKNLSLAEIGEEFNITKQGVRKGLVEGEKVGLEKGLVEGEKKAKIESARKMLIDGLPIDMVAKYSGLSLEEVEDVK